MSAGAGAGGWVRGILFLSLAALSGAAAFLAAVAVSFRLAAADAREFLDSFKM